MTKQYLITGDVKCIFCKDDLKEIHINDVNSMYSDAIVDEVTAGYGSSNDGSVYLIAICDYCIDKENIKKIGQQEF